MAKKKCQKVKEPKTCKYCGKVVKCSYNVTRAFNSHNKKCPSQKDLVQKRPAKPFKYNKCSKAYGRKDALQNYIKEKHPTE